MVAYVTMQYARNRITQEIGALADLSEWLHFFSPGGSTPTLPILQTLLTSG